MLRRRSKEGFIPTPNTFGAGAQSARGFTLLEVLVVVSIVAILASMIILSMRGSQLAGRNAERQADLRLMQAALEQYRKEVGRYPEGCNGAGNLSGGPGTGYECASSGEEYIIGLAPEYIRTLPQDPRLNPDETHSGYVYVTNSDGTVYKLMALNSAETEDPSKPPVVVSSNPNNARNMEFARCGDIFNTHSICNRVYSQPTGTGGSTQNPPAECRDDDTFAVFGGFADRDTEVAVEYYTERIICDIDI